MQSTSRVDTRRAARRLYELLLAIEHRHLEEREVVALRDWLCRARKVTGSGHFDDIISKLNHCAYESRLEAYERNAIMLMCSRAMNDSRPATNGAAG